MDKMWKGIWQWRSAITESLVSHESGLFPRNVNYSAAVSPKMWMSNFTQRFFCLFCAIHVVSSIFPVQWSFCITLQNMFHFDYLLILGQNENTHLSGSRFFNKRSTFQLGPTLTSILFVFGSCKFHILIWNSHNCLKYSGKSATI